MSSDSPSAVSSGLLLFLLFSIIDKSCEDGDRSTDFMSQPEEFYRQTLSNPPLPPTQDCYRRGGP